LNAVDHENTRRLDQAKAASDAALRQDNKYLWYAYHQKMEELHTKLASDHREKAERLENEIGSV
jgi:hypothetical protein